MVFDIVRAVFRGLLHFHREFSLSGPTSIVYPLILFPKSLLFFLVMKVKNGRKNDVFDIMMGVFYSSLRAVSK